MMNSLERILGMLEAFERHGSPETFNVESLYERLAGFERRYPVFCHYLSASLYDETRQLLMARREPITSPPEVAVIMAVHRPRADLLEMAIRSALEQIGVATRLMVSIDGEPDDLELVSRVLAGLPHEGHRVTMLQSPVNEGVGCCRNRALKACTATYFTFLDSDDVFHPLRCLHAWLLLESQSLVRVNTGYSRVSLDQGKLVLLNNQLWANGGTSFLAHTSVLSSYGYLAPLRFWEDTEYQNRLTHYQARMLNAAAVGHYQHTECDPGYHSLATRWRQEAHVIRGHPYLCGTTWGAMDEETAALSRKFQDLYAQLEPSELVNAFPP